MSAEKCGTRHQQSIRLELLMTRWNCVFLFPIENVHFRLHMFQTAVEKLGWIRYISTTNNSKACPSTCEYAWSVKAVPVQNSFCSLQLLPKHVVQTNRSDANCLKSHLYLLVFSAYFDTERNCLKSKLELMRYHLVVAFCIIILAVYSTACYDKCLKNGEHQKLF